MRIKDHELREAYDTIRDLPDSSANPMADRLRLDAIESVMLVVIRALDRVNSTLVALGTELVELENKIR